MASSKTVATISEEEAWDRFVLIVKPEQSGKTFVMITKINEFLKEPQTAKIVNFILCDNSLLLTSQTKNRIQTDVENSLEGIEEPYVEFSSAKNAKKDYANVRESIEEGATAVICCTNRSRVKGIITLIDKLNRHSNQEYKFNIWLDEADKRINYIKDDFIPLLQKEENVNIYMLTATPQPIFQKYKEVYTMALENTTIPSYHGWNDCDIVLRANESETTVGFARQIVDEMEYDGLLVPGVKGYVPADTQKKSHIAMKDMLIKKGIAVFIVNGDGIELALPREQNAASAEPPEPIQIKKELELHIHIRGLYIEHNVSRWPCVVTGNICVGRGISIQQPDFMFNFGILSNCTKKTEASQNAGRLKGNFKEWDGYAPPRVYTTENFNKIATEYENQSREIAKIAFKKVSEQGASDTGCGEGCAKVTTGDIKNTLCKDWEVIYEEFDTLEEANKKLKNYKCRGKTVKSLNKDHDGFILSSTTGKLSVLHYDHVKNEMNNWSPTSLFDTKSNKNVYGRLIIVYKDIKDKESVKYLVRIAVKKNQAERDD